MNHEEIKKRRNENAAIIKDMSVNYTIAEIAKHLNLSVATVNDIQNDPQYGIVNPRRRRPGYNKTDRSKVAEGCLDYNKMGRMF